MPVILDGVGYRYRTGIPVLVDVAITLEPGEAVAVMGPSGSGKSTLLFIAGLLLTPTSGRVLVDGEPAAPRRSVPDHAAWVFQSTATLPRRTALDNVVLGTLGAGRRRRDAVCAAMSALEAVGLGELADRPVEALSGGERQRVGIARAFVQRPRIVLADEPTGQLDAGTSARVVDSLLSLTTTDVTLLVATHDPTVAAQCDRTVRLVDGRVLASCPS